jgi:hypothetical protein
LKKLPAILLFLILLVSCSFGVRHNKDLEKSIQSTQQKDSKVDLNELTDFAWDRAYLFPPYTDQATINEKLGFTFEDPSNIKTRDDIYLLIFVNNDKAVQYAEVTRNYGELIPKNDVITPSHAILKVERF